jgi:hypothetical protein
MQQDVSERCGLMPKVLVSIVYQVLLIYRAGITKEDQCM